jgi:hypothetical protein
MVNNNFFFENLRVFFFAHTSYICTKTLIVRKKIMKIVNIKKMKVINYISKALSLCTECPALCEIAFVSGYNCSESRCSTFVEPDCFTINPPTVWQLGKYRLRCRRRLLLSSRQAQEHIKNHSLLSPG